jgi:3-hydroxy-9,10-secoandrosta-1,3,5(10)-triene-9,17-dione monooxygenase reductase component
MLIVTQPPDEGRALRSALGRFSTGVAIVTTLAPDARHTGVTVNSFTSVSLEPPLVLFSLARRAHIYDVFAPARVFTVNVLSQKQKLISNRFTRPGSLVWDDIVHHIGANGCAVLADSLAWFECERHVQYEGGDHGIFVGRVSAFGASDEAADPLVFYRGNYGSFVGDERVHPDLSGTLGDFTSYGWGGM